jgi:DNA-binding NtrC family response regulator
MKPLKTLVVHADSSRREQLTALLHGADATTLQADGGETAAAQLDGSVDLLLLDLRLAGLDLEELRRLLSPPVAGEPDSLEAAERRHLSLVLRHTAGNKRRAALILGISRSTLLNKVRKYHLEGR